MDSQVECTKYFFISNFTVDEKLFFPISAAHFLTPADEVTITIDGDRCFVRRASMISFTDDQIDLG